MTSDPSLPAKPPAPAAPGPGPASVPARDIEGDAATRPPVAPGSWLLASAAQRVGAAALVSAALWGLTGWAMGWW